MIALVGTLLVTNPVGVVTLPSGSVSVVTSTGASRPARAGAVLELGDTVDTATVGWVEVQLVVEARIRSSAATRATYRPQEIMLSEGRVWVEVPERVGLQLVVSTPSRRVDLDAGASAIIEHSRTQGTVVTVRAGRAVVKGDRNVSIVSAGQTLMRGAQARTGGRATWELVAAEAKRARGDWTGLESYLLGWLSRFEVGQLRARGVSRLLRLDSEVAGAHTRSSGFWLEESIRPPPFFEEEVPPKGPNVRVEVEFGED